jgi:hypothetical protein
MMGWKKISAVGLIILLPACAGMRNLERNEENTRATADSSLHIEQIDQVKSDKSIESLTLKRDTLNNSYTVQIWPKGKFSYNAAVGFEGDAEKILITGTVKQGKQSLSTNSLKESRDTLVKRESDLQMRSNTAKDTVALKKVVSWKAILGYALIAIVAIALLLIFGFIRKQFVAT